MFISKAEKSNLYKLIADLHLRVVSLENIISKTPVDIEKAFSSDAYRKEYAKKYYWKKKAERLANGSTEGVRIKKSVEETK